jgi:hypothetical protein
VIRGFLQLAKSKASSVQVNFARQSYAGKLPESPQLTNDSLKRFFVLSLGRNQ